MKPMLSTVWLTLSFTMSEVIVGSEAMRRAKARVSSGRRPVSMVTIWISGTSVQIRSVNTMLSAPRLLA